MCKCRTADRKQEFAILAEVGVWLKKGDVQKMNSYRPTRKNRRKNSAFTLIELLTVIAIIGILAALLLVAIIRASTSVKVKATLAEMSMLAAAVTSYQGDFGRLPADATMAKSAGNHDFTYGTVNNVGALEPGSMPPGTPVIANPSVGPYAVPYNAWNSNLMAVLIPSVPGANTAANPRKTPYFMPHTAAQPGAPGLGPDNVLRDPFSNPYIIALDLNSDGVCRDAFYSTLPDYATAYPKDIPGSVIVWSMGPDRTVDPSSGVKAGKNKDNVTSW